MNYLLLSAFLGFTVFASAGDITPVVAVEEDVYTYTNANNGAGPMWCHGSTSLVRSGGHVFASGIETIPDAMPLNNCRWMLFQRGTSGWSRVRVDTEGRTREPAPIAAFADGRVFLSVNATLDKEAKSGPAQPDVLQFRADDPKVPPVPLTPVWKGKPAFTEHSYRSFVADSAAGELLLFQNVGYTHAEWTFRDRAGTWSAQGKLEWPWSAEYGKAEPVRICYPNVALRDRAVHFVGVSDVLEPNPVWRKFKRELTGQQWDYDFRRLFYTWTPDLVKAPFAKWVEIASREKTCGRIWPGDLWLAPNGDAHLLWSERALDLRLREKFFPDAKQSEALNYAVVRNGKVLRRCALVETKEETPGIAGSSGRFHVAPDNRLFVVHRASSADKKSGRIFENRIVEILPDGAVGTPVRIPFQKPFTSFFTTTVRAGSPPSWSLELFGQRAGAQNTMSYARVELAQSR